MQDKRIIVIIGAGRSSTALINYLLAACEKYPWEILLCDTDEEAVQAKIKGHPSAQGIRLDIQQSSARQALIQSADIVISLLPAHMHPLIAFDCLELGKSLVTASYVSQELWQLHEQFREKEIFLMGELGLDPGIDHMSAVSRIREIKRAGGKITAFRSYTGGLVAPENDDNPWHYKITWNPRNVVLAGKGTTRFVQDKAVRYLPYHRLFRNYRKVDIPNWGIYEVYPNRDAIKYQKIYGLEEAEEIYRGTIRRIGFCDAWNVLVQMGITDDEVVIENNGKLTYHQWTASFFANKRDLSSALVELIQAGDVHKIMAQLKWLGLFESEIIPFQSATSAQILQNLLMDKWKLKPDERDLILMQHEFEYTQQEQNYCEVATLAYKGQDAVNTAMTKLVGLPLGIFVKNVLLSNISLTGVQIPITPEVYHPILLELADHGVIFNIKKRGY